MGNYKKWTDVEIDYIKQHHNTVADEDLAQKLSQLSSQSVTTAMIRRQRRKLRLSKPRGRPRKTKQVVLGAVQKEKE
jgi:hypothetical protein